MDGTTVDTAATDLVLHKEKSLVTSEEDDAETVELEETVAGE